MMYILGMFVCIVASFFMTISVREEFTPERIDFYLAMLPLVVGYWLFYKYVKEIDW